MRTAAPKRVPTDEEQLRRSVASCLLWEREFYEDGETIADRIERLARKVSPAQVLAIAAEARICHQMRHVPLLICSAMFGQGVAPHLIEVMVDKCVQRADEMGELLAVYWRDGKKPIPAAVKRALRKKFVSFSPYEIAKYQNTSSVSLRDVMFLTHPKTSSPALQKCMKALANKSLPSPDTWEVALSAGADKKATFERLIREGKLGYLALLRNLRNMHEAGCDRGLVIEAITARHGAGRVLPFRYLAAARACPAYSDAVSEAMIAAVTEVCPPLAGSTLVMVDVSGSMEDPLSAKSDLTRMDAAAALASIVHGGDVRIWTFSNEIREVMRCRGLVGIDSVIKSQLHRGTALALAVSEANKVPLDRLIVVTDEQGTDGVVPPPTAKNSYMINVASNDNGVSHAGGWVSISGFSEGCLGFISEYESFQ